MVVANPKLSPEIDRNKPTTSWVIFSDDTDIRMLKILKRGFRHCFVIMQQNDRWILIDPKSNETEIVLLPHPASFNFPRYFAQQGKTVLKIPPMSTPHKIMLPFCFSCVETTKRFIGLHRFWILTPYQLYKSILKISRKGQ